MLATRQLRCLYNQSNFRQSILQQREPKNCSICLNRRLRVLASAVSVGQDRKQVAKDLTQTNSKEQIDVNPPKGTKDYPPEDMRLRQWLFTEFAAVSRLFGFEQYETPVLEAEELFVRKAGEEITDQLYNFQDKGGRRVALRPEITPSLARLLLQRPPTAPQPTKWFAIGECWRYERMTRGRRRVHTQWNADISGVPGVEAEAELLAMLTTFFSRVGLSAADVAIRVSSRKVLQGVLARCGVAPEAFGPVCVVVDKMAKIPREQVEAELGALGVGREEVDNIFAATAVSSLAQLEELLGAEDVAVADMRRLFQLAEGYGYADYLQLDTSTIRGLAYYTGTVFEAFDREGKLRAVCGGGRYDKLLGLFGGADQPCAGFGFGDAVIVELLKEKNLLPDLKPEVDDMVLVMDEALRPAACGIAARLRRSGRTVDLVLEGKRMKWAFKHAERCGARRLILVAPDEFERGTVRVKDLASRQEADVLLADLEK